MFSIWMVLGAIGLMSVSGLPAYAFSYRSAAGQRLSAGLMVLGSLLGLGGLGARFQESGVASVQCSWFLPWGQFAVALDALSVAFLLPALLVPALGAIYGLGYWKQSDHPANGRRLGLFYGWLAGSMAMVVIARDGLLFLIAWEVMALSAYFASTVEEHNPEVRQAGWVYLIATHVGTLCLIAMFALWRQATGSMALDPAGAMSAAMAGTIFVLALVGFGFKAGLMPLHLWLPGAHANAPSHVSAVMSGVMLKMGIYGIVRMTAILPTCEAWWGGLLLAAGLATGLAGIAFAIGQRDLKRLLAYSSVENIGIIAMGLGLALLGRAYDRADWLMLGFCGALLHVWNHALFKSLLFLGAGAIIHGTDTRQMDHLGGLARRMPWTASLFTVGAVAICALPPLNGFVSEWLIYLGLFRTLGIGGDSTIPAAASACVGLAMIGALAVACFVKLLGTVFLGEPRSHAVAHAHDPSAAMISPMILLALGCLALGVGSMFATPLLEKAAGTWAAAMPAAAGASLHPLAPLKWISIVGLSLLGLLAAGALVWKFRSRSPAARQSGTWDCGYAQPTVRMQYTGSSLGQMLVDLGAFLLWPRRQEPELGGTIAQRSRFASDTPDTVLDRLVIPVFGLAGRYFPRLRVLQQGQTQIYVLYILVAVILLFLVAALGALP